MIRDKELHHENILEAATGEFLEYGFMNASMRRIASKVGMSASGLYKHFTSKEEMFSAIVDPAFKGLLKIYKLEESDQKEFITEGNLTEWTNGQEAKLALSYIYDNYDAFRLIVCKSQGTNYENYVHDLAVLEEDITLKFMDLLKNKGVKIKNFSFKELHLLTTANINAIFQAVEHEFSKEEAMHYADTLDNFFSRAWEGFFRD